MEDAVKDALADFIVVENLPFTIVESKYFINILDLYDERVGLDNFPEADAIADQVKCR